MIYDKKAVVFGAGGIGRGFIGQILHDSGYEIVFVDINETLIRAINHHKTYPLTLTDGQTSRTMMIDHIRAVNASDADRVAQELEDCDLAATAVGKNALPYIAPTLALGLRSRYRKRPKHPLNILICENINQSRDYLYDLLGMYFVNEDLAPLLSAGLVQTTIGRMVPVPEPVKADKAIPAIVAEPYCCLPIERTAFRGTPPFLKYTETFEPFAFFEEKKLFIHNLGHAACAYFGALKGCCYIWQAIGDAEIASRTAGVMNTMSRAIAGVYHTEEAELLSFAKELIKRFANRALGDTVARVCTDPLRKLQKGDRFMGAVERCKAQSLPYENILYCVAATLLYEDTKDPGCVKMQGMMSQNGIHDFLTAYCGLEVGDSLAVSAFYQQIKIQYSLTGGLSS